MYTTSVFKHFAFHYASDPTIKKIIASSDNETQYYNYLHHSPYRVPPVFQDCKEYQKEDIP